MDHKTNCKNERTNLINERKNLDYSRKQIKLLLETKYQIKITVQYLGMLERNEKNPGHRLAIALTKIYNKPFEFLFENNCEE